MRTMAKKDLCDEKVDKDIVAEASAHDEEVENLVGAEVFVPGIKERKL